MSKTITIGNNTVPASEVESTWIDTLRIGVSVVGYMVFVKDAGGQEYRSQTFKTEAEAEQERDRIVTAAEEEA